ncbi:hypothetical protein L6R52_20285 [Myxococcota bacterium]|nr:hypothetical protein [Myxococcota bacterium]
MAPRLCAALGHGLALLTLAALAGPSACTEAGLDGGLCVADADCAAGATCVFDLTRGSAYCTRTCLDDSDCLPTQSCRVGTDRAESGAIETRLCIDRVRACSEAELCNGLDDDCDGVIDGPSCAAITNCLDDATCGVFVCTAPSGATAALCAAPNTSATVPDFAPCTEDAQCRTGLCETGLCSPLCRPRSPACEPDQFCVEAVGPRDRPRHNNCQKGCKTTADCPTPQQCVFREVYRGPDAPPAGTLHAFVCSLPGPERKALGEACSSNTLEGDAECAGGLCFGGVCTRPCETGDRCTDVGTGFACARELLRYGTAQEVAAEICEKP